MSDEQEPTTDPVMAEAERQDAAAESLNEFMPDNVNQELPSDALQRARDAEAGNLPEEHDEDD